MEIGEQQLSWAHQLVLGLNRLFHLYNHLCLTIDVFNRREYLSSHNLILLVGKATSLASGVLHIDSVPIANEFCYSCGSHSHTILIVFDFFWYSDFHDLKRFC